MQNVESPLAGSAQRLPWLAFLAVVLPVLPACSGAKVPEGAKPTFPVKGRVLLDEQPLGGAIVTFHPLDEEKAAGSYAKTDEAGYFALSTYRPSDGAPAGRYAVTVLLQQGDDGINLLPAMYGSPATSGLSAIVNDEATELPPFRLRRR